MANYPGTKLVGVGYKLRKKMKNSPSCVHILHKTSIVVISRCCFAEDGKEMYQNVHARAERLFLLIKPIFLRRCRCPRRRRCLSSLISSLNCGENSGGVGGGGENSSRTKAKHGENITNIINP